MMSLANALVAWNIWQIPVISQYVKAASTWSNFSTDANALQPTTKTVRDKEPSGKTCKLAKIVWLESFFYPAALALNNFFGTKKLLSKSATSSKPLWKEAIVTTKYITDYLWKFPPIYSCLQTQKSHLCITKNQFKRNNFLSKKQPKPEAKILGSK